MKKIMLSIAAMIAGMVFGAAEPTYEVDNFKLHGEIDGENITFDLSFDADVHDKKADMLLLAGDVGLLDCDPDARG